MKYKSILAEGPRKSLWLRKAGENNPSRVCTVSQACQKLRRTRRQVYRQIEEGHLESRGKCLGECLLDWGSVQRLAEFPLCVHPLPQRLLPLFPEYELPQLNAGRDKVLIFSRILENGGRKDLCWMLGRYPREDIRRFLRNDGSRLLSERSLRLWSLFFKTKPIPIPAWRKADPWRKNT